MNSENWKENRLTSKPELGKEVWALIDRDYPIDEANEPWLAKLTCHLYTGFIYDKYYWKIVDWLDYEDIEEVLQQQYTVIYWRYVN